MNRTTARLTASAFALVLLLGACSSDDDGDADDTSATTAPQEQTTDTTDDSMDEADNDSMDEADNGTMEDADIVDTAVAAGDFETLVTAVQAAELEETLRGEGPFTVFAPADEAFAALPEGTVEGLLEDPTGPLADILTYHVVEGAVMAADVVGLDGQEVTTVNGATFTVNVADDGSVSITDAAGNEIGVVQTDIETSNGVIHVIDGVLMPA